MTLLTPGAWGNRDLQPLAEPRPRMYYTCILTPSRGVAMSGKRINTCFSSVGGARELGSLSQAKAWAIRQSVGVGRTRERGALVLQ